MANLSTTKLSSKGQVVIPEIIREQMGLRTGDQFVVIADRDVVILKTLHSPSIAEFNKLISNARSQAKKARLTRKSVDKAIKETRSK